MIASSPMSVGGKMSVMQNGERNEMEWNGRGESQVAKVAEDSIA